MADKSLEVLHFGSETRKYVEDFNRACRWYWKHNVSKHFMLHATKYDLPVKMNHRVAIYDADEYATNEPRIRNAIAIKWYPNSGTVIIGTSRIMVKGVSSHETVKVNRKDLNLPPARGRPGMVNVRVYNLIDLISLPGQKHTPGAFRIGRSLYGGVRYGYRIKTGVRRPTDVSGWQKWMNEFIPFVDMQLVILATKLEEKYAEKIKTWSLQIETRQSDDSLNTFLADKLIKTGIEEF